MSRLSYFFLCLSAVMYVKFQRCLSVLVKFCFERRVEQDAIQNQSSNMLSYNYANFIDNKALQAHSGSINETVGLMHNAIDIARRILEIANERGNTLTPMQLLKLVYIAHGWMLGLYRRPLIEDRIEAWKFGPVIPNLYHAIKQYRDKPVQQVFGSHDPNLDSFESDLLEQICDIYCRFDGISLSKKTHEQGTPWDQVYMSDLGNITIPNDIIERHYLEKSKAQ